jgi:3-hydroxybutyryl-CoA dehydratase
VSELVLDDLVVGATFRSRRRTVTEADITSFSAITGDYSPLHADEVYIAEETDLRDRIAQGWLIVAIQSGLPSEIDRWSILAYVAMDRRFTAPVYPGDTLHAEYVIEEIRPSESKPDRGIVRLACRVVNQDGVAVSTGSETFMLARSSR